MALPQPRRSYEEFTDSLLYFQARLEANPKTQELAERIAALIHALDEAQQTLQMKRRQEILTRAKRDFIDSEGDDQIAAFRQELSGFVASTHPILKGLFPKGVRAVLNPTGLEQAFRLEELQSRIEQALQGPDLEEHPRKEKVTEVLTSGKATVSDFLERLKSVNALWQTALLELGLARDREQAGKEAAYSEAGSVLGRLRELLGGSASAAQEYTRQAPSRRANEEPDAAAPAESD